MKKLLILVLLQFSISAVFGNNKDSIIIDGVQKNILNIEQTMSRMRIVDEQTKFKMSEVECQLDSLQKVILEFQKNITGISEKFLENIKETENTVSKNAEMFSGDIRALSVYGIIIFFVVTSIALIIYFILRKHISKNVCTISQIKEIQQNLQEESLKLDDKLLEILDKQINLCKTQAVDSVIHKDTTVQPDHSLALKVADEIVRIEINLSRMDSSIKGYKQLSKAVERIKNNFLANGYEMVDMLGKTYNDGMKVIANLVSDENLKEGEQIITGIIKPQINYKGKMIQAAQITVSQNI